MTRYEWPRTPWSRDRPAQRARHVEALRPGADPSTPSAVPPAAPAVSPAAAGGSRARRGRSRVVPKNAPAVAQPFGWIPVGPSVMTNGQATGTPNVAGRIRDLAVEPTTGDRAYAASASGGVWFTADRGASWAPLDEWVTSDRGDVPSVANALACGSIHVAWGAGPASDEVWVGTGELLGDVDVNPGRRLRGVGILHATGPAGAGRWTVEKGAPATGTGSDPDTLRNATVMRIVADPRTPAANPALLAMTSRGLYARVGGTWSRLAPIGLPRANGLNDLAVTLGANPGELRIWVTGQSVLAVAELAVPLAAGQVPAFLPVALPGVLSVGRTTRLALTTSPDGATVWVLGRRDKPATAKASQLPPAALWRVASRAGLAGLAGTTITGVPAALFGARSDQSYYDMCLAAHPTVTDRVFVGGSAVDVGNVWNGAVYRLDVHGTTCEAQYVGTGTHSDVHTIRPTARTAGPQHVWVGCDGGVFRSADDGDPDSFRAVNDGLAVLEPGYVASHPTNPGLIAAGFQDNGTAARAGDSVWVRTFAGDGGGLVYHPTDGDRLVRQYIHADWESSGGRFTRPVKRRLARDADDIRNSETVESENALFYTGADTVFHRRETHLALGSDRVWYSRDFGGSWVTLPSGTDPRGTDNPDLVCDVLDPTGVPAGSRATFSERTGSVDCCNDPVTGVAAYGAGVVTVKFAALADDEVNDLERIRVLALTSRTVSWLTGTRALGAATGFTWSRTQSVFRGPATPQETSDLAAGKPVSFVPIGTAPSDLAVHRPDRGPLGSCYLATLGGERFRTSGTPGARLDTLWFFDGVLGLWHPTGLRMANPAVPEAAWPAGTRVTAPALGVVVDPEDPALVYVATSVGVVRGTLTIAGTAAAPTYSWAWEQFMNGLPEAAVQDLSIHWYPRPPDPGDPAPAVPPEAPVKLLRAALQARGVWEVDIGTSAVPTPLTYLRTHALDTRRRVPTPLAGPTLRGVADAVHWDESPDLCLSAPGAFATPPSEAELLAAGRPPAAELSGARYRATAGPQVVHVLVHHRWPEPAAPGDVRVALLRHDLPDDGSVPLGGLWPVLVAAGASGTPPAALPDGWTPAAASLWNSPARPVDPRSPRAVAFPVDWSAEPADARFVLLAVVMSASNPLGPADLVLGGGATAATADQLVVSSPHVAAISVVV